MQEPKAEAKAAPVEAPYPTQETLKSPLPDEEVTKDTVAEEKDSDVDHGTEISIEGRRYRFLRTPSGIFRMLPVGPDGKVILPARKNQESKASATTAPEEKKTSDTSGVRALSLYDIEQVLAAETNAARIAQGLQPLVVSQGLIESARKHTLNMARQGNIFHGGTSGWDGENVAYGQNSPKEVVNTWMNSSGHRANMLGSHTEMGVSCFSRNGTLFWTQQFK
jgi:hypothetical protein